MDGLAFAGATFCSNSGLLTAAGAEAVYDTTVVIDYVIDGIAYRKATQVDGAAITTDANTGVGFVALGANKTCFFVWMLNAAGTVSVAQGPIVDGDLNDDTLPANAFPTYPAVPDGRVPFAVQRVQRHSTGAAWTFGTSNWNATAIKDVIANVSHLPNRILTTAVA